MLGADCPEMMLMLVNGTTVDEDIVKVDHQKLTGERMEYFVHESHESTRSIGETEWHDEQFIKALASLEGRLPLIALPDLHLMISIPEIQL